jgi:hypothetical protein
MTVRCIALSRSTGAHRFRKPPEVVGRSLARAAEEVWSDWHPLLWQMIRHRGRLGGAAKGACSSYGPRATGLPD